MLIFPRADLENIKIWILSILFKSNCIMVNETGTEWLCKTVSLVKYFSELTV
jgi:hypothetical protein